MGRGTTDSPPSRSGHRHNRISQMTRSTVSSFPSREKTTTSSLTRLGQRALARHHPAPSQPSPQSLTPLPAKHGSPYRRDTSPRVIVDPLQAKPLHHHPSWPSRFSIAMGNRNSAVHPIPLLPPSPNLAISPLSTLVPITTFQRIARSKHPHTYPTRLPRPSPPYHPSARHQHLRTHFRFPRSRGSQRLPRQTLTSSTLHVPTRYRLHHRLGGRVQPVQVYLRLCKGTAFPPCGGG